MSMKMSRSDILLSLCSTFCINLLRTLGKVEINASTEISKAMQKQKYAVVGGRQKLVYYFSTVA